MFFHSWFQEERKWNVYKRNVRVNDYVIVADPNAIRGSWNAGRIVQIFPGGDGIVRNVLVKTKNGEYRRPVNKICVIHPAEGYNGD